MDTTNVLDSLAKVIDAEEKSKYTWEEIGKVVADKDGVCLLPKEEEKAEEIIKTKEKYPYPYPKPLAQDSLQLQLDASKLVHTDGDVLLVKDVVVAKEIVQDYNGKKIYKPSEEIKAMTPFLDGVPIVFPDHPESEMVTDRRQVAGKAIRPRFVDGAVIADLEIYCDELKKLIESGKLREVSLGFFADVVDECGTFNGDQYQAVQRNIFPDHVAVVEHGRCSISDGCGIKLDSVKLETVQKKAQDLITKEKQKIIDEIIKTAPFKEAERKRLQADTLERLALELDTIQRVKASVPESLVKKDSTFKDIRAEIDARYEKISKGR